MEGKREDEAEVGVIESDSSDSFIDDDDEANEEVVPPEEPLTEEEVEELIAEFLEIESKAAEAQETLEKESLIKVEKDVREELALTLTGDDLENAIADEMITFKEEWEAVLDELETESSHLLEQLDGAGIALPSLYKWIESQAPKGCCTEAWKRRAHWVGSQVTSDITELVTDAEMYLQSNRPVRRQHGKLLEEGASGFLQKKLAQDSRDEDRKENSEVDWCMFNKIISAPPSSVNTSFGSRNWASVYLASTPQQAVSMGLKFPGIDEVEEIDAIDDTSSDPFVSEAIKNEQQLDYTEEHKRKFRKVKEEDDANLDLKLQLHLKRRRRKKRTKEVMMDDNFHDALPSANAYSSDKRCGDERVHRDNGTLSPNKKTDVHNAVETSTTLEKERSICDGEFLVCSESSSLDSTRTKGSKRSRDVDELDTANKKCRTAFVDNDNDAHVEQNKSTVVHENGYLKEKFHCTACGAVTVDVHHHPLLKVIVCRDCKYLLKAKMHLKDPDCPKCCCGWCGQSSELINCKSCKTLFCTKCIKRNIGEEFLSEVQVSGWQCCCCVPGILQQLTVELEKAISSTTLTVSSSSSGSDSDNSDANGNAGISSTKKRKKRIRRIIDDAELGEETKRKLAIEKERQDRLKCLQEQFSSSSRGRTFCSSSFNGNLPDGASVEVFGDPITGYIVNVVREKGEEVVRVPPSISAKLKTHQISGIRFLWENIVQSIRKVKSGDKGLGCILAHTMGLGKTFQVIAFLYTAMRSIDLGLRTALIVTPVNVLHNWRQEFVKWRPSELKPLRVFMLDDVSRDRRQEVLAKWKEKGGIFLIGYSSFRSLSLGKNVKDRIVAREISCALHEVPDLLICDEAHMIKNTRADATQALKQVKCQRRIALTGSPLQNNLMEYYCMVDFVREGFLGSSLEFRNRFQNPIENGQHTNSTIEDVKIMSQRSHILYEELKGFVQRMDMNVAKKDLPPKTVFVIAVKLSPLQRKLYKKFLDMHGYTNDQVSSEKIRKSFFAGYQALAQIWNHPGILQLRKEVKDSVRREETLDNFIVDDCSSDDNLDYNIVTGEKLGSKADLSQGKHSNGVLQQDWWNDLLRENNFKDVEYSGKMVLLLDILKMCSDVGDKALVFSQSIPTLDLIERYLSKLPRQEKMQKNWKKGEDWYRLDGKTEASERQKLVERFNEPLNNRVKCVLISTRAGSLGINLYAANRVIIFDGSWNPTYDLQAIYRAWRYGQLKPVFAYRFMAHGTMEEKIYKRQVTKEGLSARVVDKQQVHRTMSKEEMLHLFDFGDDENQDTLSENGHRSYHNSLTGDHLRQKFPTHGSCSSDKIMEGLLERHSPRWIANYHEHETLLQENEDEKLSKEEQDMAWEIYQKTLEWEEVKRFPVDEVSLEQKPKTTSTIVPPPVADTKSRNKLNVAESSLTKSRNNLRNHTVQRKCTTISHYHTLRSQGTKPGCRAVCGECAQEICWSDMNKANRSAR